MSRKLLIVDKNEIDRAVLKKLFETDYAFAEAADGRTALRILKEESVNISAVILGIVMPLMDGFELLSAIREDSVLMRVPVIMITDEKDGNTEERAIALGADECISKPYNQTVVRKRVTNIIALSENTATEPPRKDSLTGLYTREAFFEKAEMLIKTKPSGYYVLSCIDIDNFKVINNQYGSLIGDRILRYTAMKLRECISSLGGLCSRISADKFGILYPSEHMDSKMIEDMHNACMSPEFLDKPITVSVGRYIVKDMILSVSAMFDGAVIAELSVKGRYDKHTAVFDESMRKMLVKEQNIVSEMNEALEKGQFEPWIQPQYNSINGTLAGAEALVRWRNKAEGRDISPDEFVPLFENNGFIYEMDKYIWERVCFYLRKWQDEGKTPVPVSVNISRYDLLCPDFLETITGLIEKYGIPVKMLRLEITETAFSNSTEHIITVMRRLTEYGFTLEIDDFGSGYSSLNSLKDIPATILKLDMKFFENDHVSQRSGSILKTVIRMAKWLGMAVIAEGVETTVQSEYLKNIGCHYIQGYLYARPMPLSEYEDIMTQSRKQPDMTTPKPIVIVDKNNLWDLKSMDRLIFDSFVGGACIFEYIDGKTDILKANENYTKELHLDNAYEDSPFIFNMFRYTDDESKKIFSKAVDAAVYSQEEAECELCLEILDDTAIKTYVNVSLRLIASVDKRYLLYASIKNTTASKAKQALHGQPAETEENNIYIELLDSLSVNTAIFGYENGIPTLIYAKNAAEVNSGNKGKERPITDFIHTEDISSLTAEFEAAIAGKRDMEAVLRINTGDSGWKPSRIRGKAEKKDGNKYVFYTEYNLI